MNAIIDTEINELHIREVLREGVVVLKNRIDTIKIYDLTNEINKLNEIIMAKINTMARPLQTYSDIAERQLGRLDYRCGFTANIFYEVAKPISEVIRRISPDIDFNYYWGAIPSLGGSGPTDMHRDVYPILNKTEGVNLSGLDLLLPPYYFTVLIPLVKITRENGPTEFIKRSHHHQVVDESIAQIYSPLLLPGDFIIFDGRTLHRGAPNNTTHQKLIAYITFIAKWYHDQTFTVNNYLFPELG